MRAGSPARADLFAGLLDDAGVFPPGDLPVAEAVRAHLQHRLAAYAGMVGPLVVGMHHLDALADAAAGLPRGSLEVAVVAPLASVCAAVALTAAIPAVRLRAVEVATAEGQRGDEVVAKLGTLLADSLATVVVEIPRDDRRDDLVATLSGTRCLAKLRTGGLAAYLHPPADELADAIVGLVRAGVPFKATAGLHHAVRNADPVTGFEQHGFLNVLLGTDAARRGASVPEVAAVLDERDRAQVARQLGGLSAGVRSSFLSFGTCSIADPVRELVDLGLLPAGNRPAAPEVVAP